MTHSLLLPHCFRERAAHEVVLTLTVGAAEASGSSSRGRRLAERRARQEAAPLEQGSTVAQALQHEPQAHAQTPPFLGPRSDDRRGQTRLQVQASIQPSAQPRTPRTPLTSSTPSSQVQDAPQSVVPLPLAAVLSQLEALLQPSMPSQPEPLVQPELASLPCAAAQEGLRLQQALLQGLSTTQIAAVRHGHGPLLVVAGAGAGKTRVVTHRIAHLIASGVVPRQILALTFSRRAAQEMQSRCQELLPSLPEPAMIATFHALGCQVLRAFHAELGLGADFRLVEVAEQKDLLKAALRAAAISPALAVSWQQARDQIERWKNSGIGPAQAGIEAAHDGAPKGVALAATFAVYGRLCREANLVDFADQLLHVLTLLRDHPRTAAQLRARWTHVLVDEYQDCNGAQLAILAHLVGPQHSLTVVGDDDQAIYTWRGAEPHSLRDFCARYPAATTVVLADNYRSAPAIVAAANRLIAHNDQRQAKTMLAQRPPVGAAALEIVPFASDLEEAQGVALRIAAQLRAGVPPQQVAVLARLNVQVAALEAVLRGQGVPCRLRQTLSGPRQADDTPETRQGLLLLRLVASPEDDAALVAAMRLLPHGRLRSADVSRMAERLVRHAEVHKTSTWDAAHQAIAFGNRLRLPEGAAQPLSRFLRLVVSWRAALAAGLPPAELLLRQLQESGLQQLVQERHHDRGQEAVVGWLQLADSLAGIPSAGLATHLNQRRCDRDAGQAEAADPPGVTVATLHGVKGLEFDHVYLTGLEEQVLPSQRSYDDPAAIEEERRLCFVGLTRARKTLFLSWAERRFYFGARHQQRPSRFLAELLGTPVGDTAKG